MEETSAKKDEKELVLLSGNHTTEQIYIPCPGFSRDMT